MWGVKSMKLVTLYVDLLNLIHLIGSNITGYGYCPCNKGEFSLYGLTLLISLDKIYSAFCESVYLGGRGECELPLVKCVCISKRHKYSIPGPVPFPY